MSVHRLAETTGVVAFCAALPGPPRVAYEAGPTGSGSTYRMLDAAGVGCVVAPPGKIERPAQDRVKTGRRDGERLVRLLMMRHAEKHGPDDITGKQSDQRARPDISPGKDARIVLGAMRGCQSARRATSPDRDCY